MVSTCTVTVAADTPCAVAVCLCCPATALSAVAEYTQGKDHNADIANLFITKEYHPGQPVQIQLYQVNKKDPHASSLQPVVLTVADRFLMQENEGFTAKVKGEECSRPQVGGVQCCFDTTHCADYVSDLANKQCCMDVRPMQVASCVWKALQPSGSEHLKFVATAGPGLTHVSLSPVLSPAPDDVWVLFLEAAFAMMYAGKSVIDTDCYAATNGGLPYVAVMALLGRCTVAAAIQPVERH